MPLDVDVAAGDTGDVAILDCWRTATPDWFRGFYQNADSDKGTVESRDSSYVKELQYDEYPTLIDEFKEYVAYYLQPMPTYGNDGLPAVSRSDDFVDRTCFLIRDSRSSRSALKKLIRK